MQTRVERTCISSFAVGGGNWLQKLAPVFAEVDPGRVHFLDEGELFRADPALDLFFASDGAVGIVIAFVPDEAAAVVIGGESGEVFGFVLNGVRFYVAGHPGVEDAGATGDDVDVIRAFAHDRSVSVLRWFSK